MMTTRNSLDSRALKWGGVAIVAFLLGAFVTLPPAPQASKSGSGQPAPAVSASASPAATSHSVARGS
jgi:hypothetical protein